jgi:hypothetical protein
MKAEVLRLVPSLGYRNVARVGLHRLKKRLGWYERSLPLRAGAGDGDGPVFSGDPTADVPPVRSGPGEAEELTRGRMRIFGTGPYLVGSPPDWFVGPLSGRRVADPTLHWSRIDDFGSGVGDIKEVWELSRFAWAVELARAFRASGDPRFLATLNRWVADWRERNPWNQGPNWKCGQESSFRLMHLLEAARITGDARLPDRALLRSMVIEHCRRIEATFGYGRAQDNNHGISEACALLVGGLWLSGWPGRGRREAERWRELGERALSERCLRLIAEDGSFSQGSMTYHRLVVDTLTQVGVFARELGAARVLSSAAEERVRKAVDWLAAFTDPISGDAPNLGANDGSHVFTMTEGPYRDFRPSIRRAREIFGGGAEDAAGIRVFPDGGYVRIALPGSGASWLMIRVPRYAFRPGDSDPLHLDLWHRGRNLLRDGGSFSYNAPDPTIFEYLSGPAGHNTIQFDGRDPMPRVGRFLRSHWIHATNAGSWLDGGDVRKWSGSYRDHAGAEHAREVSASENRVEVVDRCRGFTDHAILRWRLEPGPWRLDGARCVGDVATLEVSVPPPGASRIALVEGRESRRYGELTPLPVLEVEVPSGPGWTEIRTIIELRP